LFFQKSNVDTSKNKQFITLIFYANSSKTNVLLNPKDHEEYKWIKPSEINDYKTVDYLRDCVLAYNDLPKERQEKLL